MQTIKTAVVVVLLLVVLYGAYIAITGSQTELPAELQNMLADTELDIDVPSMPLATSNSSTSNASLTPVSPNGLSPIPSSSGDFWSNQKNSNSTAPAPGGPSKPSSLASGPSLFLPPPTDSDESDANDAPSITPPPALATSVTPPSPLQPKPDLSSDALAMNVTSPKNSEMDSTKSESNATIPGKLTSQTTPITPNTVGSNPNQSTTEPTDNPAESAAKKAALTGRSFDNAKKTALEMIARNEFKAALTTMSVFYGSPELSGEQNADLLNLLDALAAETIYSRRPLLEPPYVVGPGESLEAIAKRYEIPPELLAKINAIDSTLGPMPGAKLKVFQGPFRAEVDVKRNEITLFLGELYAGRFPISTGSDPQPKEGTFTVVDKQRNRNYYGKGGLQIEGNDPRNPYGGWWIDLGHELSIHGSPEAQSSDNTSLGCISLSPLDAGDVFSMLSRGSRVTIRR